MSDAVGNKLYEALCELGNAFDMLGLPAPGLIMPLASLARVNHELDKTFGPGWYSGVGKDGSTKICGVKLFAESAVAGVEPQCPLGVGAWG